MVGNHGFSVTKLMDVGLYKLRDGTPAFQTARVLLQWAAAWRQAPCPEHIPEVIRGKGEQTLCLWPTMGRKAASTD